MRSRLLLCGFSLVALASVGACGSEMNPAADDSNNHAPQGGKCMTWTSRSGVLSRDPNASTTPVCTWEKTPGFDAITKDDASWSATNVWASSPIDVYVTMASRIGGDAWVAHFDGTTWTHENVPANVVALSLWGVSKGDVWAIGSTREKQLLLHRTPDSSDAQWAVIDGDGATPFEKEAIEQAMITGDDSSNLLVVGALHHSELRSWRKCGTTWEATPMTFARPGEFSLGGIFKPDESHVIAFGGGINSQDPKPEIYAVIEVLDNTAWRGIPIPADVAITDISSITGTSFDDLYVAALNRNADGVSRVYHVTQGLTKWALVDSPRSLRISSVMSPTGGASFAIGCEWSDQFQPAPPNCGRLARIDSAALAPMDTIAPTGGAPIATYADWGSRDLHALLLGAAATEGGVQKAEHWRAHCQ